MLPLLSVIAVLLIVGSLVAQQPDASASPVNAEDSQADPITSGPRDMLGQLGISPSQLAFLQDDVELSEIDRETLFVLLHRFSRFDPRDVRRWTLHQVPYVQLAAQAEPYRAALFRIEGTVDDLQAIVPPEALGRQLGLQQAYRLSIEAPASPYTWVVFTRRVPGSWMEGGEAWRSQRGAWTGMFVQWALLPQQRRAAVCVADWTEWYPETPSPELGIHQDDVLLASLGMDIARLKAVPSRGPLTDADTEAFYQLLASVQGARPELLFGRARPPHDWRSFLGQPADEQGKLYVVQGTARRAVRIPVSEALRERFGLRHYYELEVFVPLQRPGGVRFVDPSNPDKVRTFGTYPIVVCTPTLPAGMPVGEDIHQAVRAAGFYYKLWAYRTSYMSGSGGDDRLHQVSPLLIGSAVEPLGTELPGTIGWRVGAGVLLASLLVGSVAWAWWYHQSDRAADSWLRRWRAQRPSPPDRAPP